MPRPAKTPTSDPGLHHGFRSGLEDRLASDLKARGVSFQFETHKLSFLKPARYHKYTPDFLIPKTPLSWADLEGMEALEVLRRCLIIETKGRFVSEDRAKHILIRDQHPDLDIRFVFSNPNQRISKQSATSYADWCNGKNPKKFVFPFANKTVPQHWLSGNAS